MTMQPGEYSTDYELPPSLDVRVRVRLDEHLDEPEGGTSH